MQALIFTSLTRVVKLFRFAPDFLLFLFKVHRYNPVRKVIVLMVLIIRLQKNSFVLIAALTA